MRHSWRGEEAVARNAEVMAVMEKGVALLEQAKIMGLSRNVPRGNDE